MHVASAETACHFHLRMSKLICTSTRLFSPGSLFLFPLFSYFVSVWCRVGRERGLLHVGGSGSGAVCCGLWVDGRRQCLECKMQRSAAACGGQGH
jgi:hypothetical protein